MAESKKSMTVCSLLFSPALLCKTAVYRAVHARADPRTRPASGICFRALRFGALRILLGYRGAYTHPRLTTRYSGPPQRTRHRSRWRTSEWWSQKCDLPVGPPNPGGPRKHPMFCTYTSPHPDSSGQKSVLGTLRLSCACRSRKGLLAAHQRGIQRTK